MTVLGPNDPRAVKHPLAKTCANCRGTGKVNGSKCRICKGFGRVRRDG